MTADAMTTGTTPDAATPFRVVDGRLSWTGGGETVAIEPWGPDSVRVRCSMGRIEDTDWALLPATSDPDALRIAVDGDVATLRNGRLTVVARASSDRDWQAGGLRHDCRLAFYDADGRLLLQEVPDDGATKPRPRRYRALPGGTYRTTLSLAAADEHLAGLGVYQQRTPD
ncbi:MAG: family 31 glucosidase, partial [Cellulomonas sp.]|nr:family 31 glucosidase [Cellulomonas sp.]